MAERTPHSLPSLELGEERRLAEVVQRVARGEVTRRRAIDGLAARNGWDRPSATGGVDRALELGLIHAVAGNNGATVLRTGAPARPERRLELTPERLRMLLERAHRSQGWLARELGVTQPLVSSWLSGARPIPGRRQEVAEELLLAAAGTWLAQQRRQARLTQPELARLSGVPQPTISDYERGARCAGSESWGKLVDTLSIAAAKCEADPEPELTPEELSALLAAAPVSQSEFARRLGVTPPVVSSWLNGSRDRDGRRVRGRKRIPPNLWARARDVLARAELPPVRDRLAEEVLPAVRELVAARPGILRTQLDRELDRFGEGSLREAVRRALEAGELREGPALAELPCGLRRQYGGGLYPRGFAVPERVDRASAAATAVVAAVKAAPGRSSRDVADRVRGVEAHTAREAVRRALEAGMVEEALTVYVDRAGRHRVRAGLYPTGRAPANGSSATRLARSWARTWRARLGVGRRALSELLAAELGVSRYTVRGWQDVGVPRVRSAQVSAALEALERARAGCRSR